MNRRYWKFAGTIICGSAALFALSGCWSCGPAEQAQCGPIISEPSGASSQWQSGYGPCMTEVQPRASQSTQRCIAGVDISGSQWQPAEQRVNCCNPSVNQAQNQPRISQFCSVITASGLWQPGINPSVDRGFNATSDDGMMVYCNNDVIQESAGVSSQYNRQYNSGSRGQGNYQQDQYQQQQQEQQYQQEQQGYQQQQQPQQYPQQQYQSEPSSQSSQPAQPKSQPQKLESPRQSTGLPGSSQQHLHDQQTPSDN